MSHPPILPQSLSVFFRAGGKVCGRGELSARDSEQNAVFGACGSNEGVWSSWWDLSFTFSCVAALLCHAQEESAVSMPVNQAGSQLLRLTLCLVLLCSIKNLLYEARSSVNALGDVLAVPNLYPRNRDSLGALPCCQ